MKTLLLFIAFLLIASVETTAKEQPKNSHLHQKQTTTKPHRIKNTAKRKQNMLLHVRKTGKLIEKV